MEDMLMYKSELLERTMGTPIRKSVATAAASNGEQRFPPEAFAYDDDVTPEAVDTLRSRATKVIKSQEWEVVDGFEYSAA